MGAFLNPRRMNRVRLRIERARDSIIMVRTTLNSAWIFKVRLRTSLWRLFRPEVALGGRNPDTKRYLVLIGCQSDPISRRAYGGSRKIGQLFLEIWKNTGTSPEGSCALAVLRNAPSYSVSAADVLRNLRRVSGQKKLNQQFPCCHFSP